MATQLKNIVTFTNVAAGASVPLAHGLNVNGLAVIPDELKTDNPDFSAAADATNITVTNNGASTASVSVLAEHWHTIERAFGDSATKNLSPQPFVEGASNSNPVGTFALTALDDGSITDVYVDPLNGDDTNDGLTPATALQTTEEVYRKFPWQLLGTTKLTVNYINDSGAQIDVTLFAFHIGGGGESFFNSYQYTGSQMTPYVPATGPSTAALDAGTPVERVDQTNVASATGNRTRFNFTAAAPGWSANDLVNRFIRVTRGADLVIPEIPISENDADHVYVDTLSIVGVVLDTDTIEIVEPAVRFLGDAANLNSVTILGKSSGIEGGFSDACTFRRIAIWMPHFTGIYGVQFDRCHFVGHYGFRGLESLMAFVNCSSDRGVILTGGSTYQPYTWPDSGSSPIHPYDAAISLQVARHGADPTPYGFYIGIAQETGQRGSCVFVFGYPVSAYGCHDGGIQVNAGSFFSVWSSRNTTINGKDNSHAGINLKWNSTARINGGQYTTITGAVGDLQVQGGAAISYGTGPGQFEEAAGYNGNFTRMLDGTAAAPIGDASRVSTDVFI